MIPPAQTIDNNTPRSFVLAKQLESKGDSRRSLWRQNLLYHQQQLDKSKVRMATYPTPTERRANRQDPVAHPVQFKRSHTASPAAALAAVGGRGRVERDIMYSTGATRSQRYYYAHPLTGRLLPRQEYDSAKLITQQMDEQGRRRKSRLGSGQSVRERPQTAGESGRATDRNIMRVYEEKEEVEHSRSRAGSSNGRSARPQTAQPHSSASASSNSATQPASRPQQPESHESLDPSDYDSDEPENSASTNNPYDQLYRTLVSLLLAHRILSEDGIERLLARAAEVNGHLNRKKVEWVCDAVREEMRVRGETEDRERRDDDRRQAWQEEDEAEDESRLESEDDGDVQEGGRDEEAKEEYISMTESEWQVMAAQPFYQRPKSDNEDDIHKPQQDTPAQPVTVAEPLKAEAAKQQKESMSDQRTQQHQQDKREGQAEASVAKVVADEQQMKEGSETPADDEWYEDDNEPAEESQQQTTLVNDTSTTQYDKEIIRAESGTHTIEEGEEEDDDGSDYQPTHEDEEKEPSDTAPKEEQANSNAIQPSTGETASEDEYGNEQYEPEDEQYESDFL